MSEAVEKVSDFRVGNRGVARNQHGHDSAEGLDAQRQRSHVQQQDVLHFATEHATLDRGAYGYHFIGVHTLVRFLAVEQVLDDLHHAWDAGRTADQYDFVHLVRRKARIGERLLDRSHGALQQVFH